VKRRKRGSATFDAPDLADLASRALGLDNGAIIDAMDITLSNLCRYLPAYRQTKDLDYLGEIDLAAQALYVMAKELATRRGDRPTGTPARQNRPY